MPDGKPFPSKNTPSNRLNRNGSENVPRARSDNTGHEPLDFRALPDGTLVELVRDPNRPRLRFLIWRDGNARIQDDFQPADRLFVPPLVDPSLMSAVRLPTAVTPHGSLEDLLQRAQECISTYVDLRPQYVRLASNFILHTWFLDRSTIAPYLWVTGPYSAGKTTLLRLLHCLCRRAVLASDLSLASLYLLPSTIMPTLLVDEFDPGQGSRCRDLLRFLRAGSTQGGHVIRGGKLYPTFCPKAISSRLGPADAALASRVISVFTLPTRRVLPELNSAAQEEIASQFQGQFLNYRLQNYSRISTTVAPEMPGFTPRTRDLARALSAPLLGHQELGQQLLNDLQPQNEEAKFSRHNEPEWAVATALFQECHDTIGALTVGSLTDTVNEVLGRLGETYALQPRAVGDHLRALGLQTCKLGNLGRGLRITQHLDLQVHRLARDLGIDRSDIVSYQAVDAGYAGQPCSLCDKFDLLVLEDGRKLRTVDMYEPSRKRRRSGLYN